MATAIPAPHCKPCMDRGHECRATRRINEEDWCEACADGQACEREKLAAKVANIQAPGELLKPMPDARDLVAVMSKVLAGLFDGQITPKQASAMCQTSNTMMKAMEMADRMKARR
jgi:hypothetical protein